MDFPIPCEMEQISERTFLKPFLHSEHKMGLKFFSPMAFSAILIFRFLPYKAKSELRGKITKKIKAPFFIHCKKTVSEKSTPCSILQGLGN